MIPRSLAVPTLLAASVAVPYVATNSSEWRGEWNTAGPEATAGGQTLTGFPLTGSAAQPRTAGMPTFAAGPGATLYPGTTPLEGSPTISLADVLRMDVTKEWVYQHWPRKTTATAELDLYGVRVPLVTGTQLHDLAGSLTYYFGADGRLQLISFRGRTGDTTQIVGLVTQRFGLTPQPTVVAGEQLFQVKRGEEVVSHLRTRPAPVLWASSPHDSFSVELDLQDAATGRPLAQRLPQLPPLPQAPPATAPGANGATAGAADKPAEPTWKAFFPRRRIPADQIRNLDHGNMYQ